MLNVKPWYYSMMTGDTELVTLLGGSDRIRDVRPEVVSIYPAVFYTDESQFDVEYADNRPTASSVRLLLDIYTMVENGYPPADEIALVLARLFGDKMFHCGQNGDVPDPVSGVQHRRMRFSRGVVPSDL